MVDYNQISKGRQSIKAGSGVSFTLDLLKSLPIIYSFLEEGEGGGGRAEYSSQTCGERGRPLITVRTEPRYSLSDEDQTSPSSQLTRRCLIISMRTSLTYIRMVQLHMRCS